MAKTDSKALMAGVIKYHFWAVSLVALIAGLVCWMSATNSLSDQYNKRVQKISGDLKKVQGIATEANHPNSEVLKTVEKARSNAGDNVLGAWKELYERQEKGNPWPDSLGEDFLTMIRELKPTAEIPEAYRETYSNFIRSHLPELQKIIKARRMTEAKQTPGGSNVKSADMDALVDWVDADFGRIEKRFGGWSTTPSSAEVRLAQEDLWVYRALLRILADTNKGVTNREYAAVKRIEALDIGKGATAAWAKAAPAIGRSGGGGDEPAGGSPEAAAPGDPGAGGAADPAPATALSKELKELLDGRYVNEKGKPLGAGVPGPFPQYKMMPIHLQLLMSQDRISSLLMECANSTMPVEVRLVKLSEVGGSGGLSRMGSDDSESMPTTSSQARKAVQSTDILVEVLGIISIFNPPPAGKAAADEAVSGAASPGEAPPDAAAPNPANPPSPDQPPASPPPAGDTQKTSAGT